MLEHCLDTKDADRGFLQVSPEDGVVVLVNNLGGVSALEMGGITNEVLGQLESNWSITPVRVLSGTYMTSLNGLGFSISLLRTRDTGLGEGSSMLELLDAPSEATGWSAAVKTETWKRQRQATPPVIEQEAQWRPSNLTGQYNVSSTATILIRAVDYAHAKAVLTTALNRLIAAEPDITVYDTIAGDGDCGIGLKRGAEG